MVAATSNVYDGIEMKNGVNGMKNGQKEEETQEEKAHLWSCAQVQWWLEQKGFEEYAHDFAVKHKIDGAVLVSLIEEDLRERPLSISCLGDIKRLSNAINTLRESCSYESRNGESSTLQGSLCTQNGNLRNRRCSPSSSSLNTHPSLTTAILTERRNAMELPDGLSVLETHSSYELHAVTLLTRDEIIRQVESPDTKSKSLFKLSIAFSYCLLSLLITAFVMVLVHDRVPDMKTYPPLPDIVLDNLPLIPWAFDMCEFIGVVLCTIWVITLLFHKHRVVIARRMFSIVGTVFLLRCITMLITSLSVPGVHLECRARNHGTTWDKMKEAYHIWSRLGMSIQGVRTCGDYMFSGHTTAITLLNHFITEYTPVTWTLLHTTTWVLNLFGVFFILAGHEHYSIDVFVAFYISSRMFLYYHTYAYNHANLTATDDRMRLWFPLGWFFEAGSIGKVPCEFELPIPIWFRRKKSRNETVKKEDEVKEHQKKEDKKDKKKKRN